MNGPVPIRIGTGPRYFIRRYLRTSSLRAAASIPSSSLAVSRGSGSGACSLSMVSLSALQLKEIVIFTRFRKPK